MNRLRHDGARHAVVAAQGVWLDLADGRQVIDAANTGAPLGHAHPAMVAAMRAAAELPAAKDEWLWPPREEAARALAEIAFAGEADWFGAVRFCLSGNEANELALELAQALTGRARIATRTRAYHGATGVALAATPQPHLHGGLAFPGGRVAAPPPAAPLSVLPAPRDAAYLANAAPRWPDVRPPVAADLAGCAAVITDASQGGLYLDATWCDALGAAAADAGALWIMDEVVTGQGRTGLWFAFQRCARRPDIVTLGKSLAAGSAPCGAVVLSRRLLDLMGEAVWQNSSTFRGHPVAMAAVRTSIETIAAEGLPARAALFEPLLRERLCAIAARYPCVARVDGRGLHWTIEFSGGGEGEAFDWRRWTGDPAAETPAARVAAAALAAGAQIGTSGEAASVFLAPPLVIGEAELDQIVVALEAGLRALG
jgi:4-aminobutyrate aminotransferase-like enzyme